MTQSTTLVHAARPEDLKTAIDALISDGETIVQILETSSKTFYLVVHAS